MLDPADPLGAVFAGNVVALSIQPPRSLPEQVAAVRALAGYGLAEGAHGAGLSTRIGDERGVLARVIRTGVMRCRDAVRLAPGVHNPWSNDWRERVVRVLSLVPPDRWVTFSQLAELAGVAPVYCRAFPRLLSSLPDSLKLRAGSAGGGETRGAPWKGEGLHDRLLVRDGSSAWN